MEEEDELPVRFSAALETTPMVVGRHLGDYCWIVLDVSIHVDVSVFLARYHIYIHSF